MTPNEVIDRLVDRVHQIAEDAVGQIEADLGPATTDEDMRRRFDLIGEMGELDP